jgi:hypothetical protein
MKIFDKLKKIKPLYVLIGVFAIIIIYFLLSRQSSGGDTTYTVGSSGPSDAAIQANAGITAAQINASGQVALQQQQSAEDIAIATLQAQVANNQTAAGADTTNKATDAALAGLLAQLTAQTTQTQIQAEYSFDTAQAANEAALTSKAIDAGMFAKQLDTNVAMYSIQSNNLVAQSLIGQISNLKKGDRDAALISLASGTPSSHGSITGPQYAPTIFDYTGATNTSHG